MNSHHVVTPSALALLAVHAVAARIKPGRGRKHGKWRQLSVDFTSGSEPEAIESLARGVSRRGWRRFKPLPEGASSVTVTAKGVSVRLSSQWLLRTDQTVHRFDVLGAR